MVPKAPVRRQPRLSENRSSKRGGERGNNSNIEWRVIIMMVLVSVVARLWAEKPDNFILPLPN
jgi:hypothetical protein